MKPSIRMLATVGLLLLFLFVGAPDLFAQSKSAEKDAPRSNVNEEKKKNATYDWDDDFLKSTSRELRTELSDFLKKIGSSSVIRVKTSQRFIFVYDVSDSYVEWISALLEEVAKAFDKFIEKTGVEVDELNEPMTVVLFATREEFDAYAVELRGPSYMEQENKPTGFYHQRLNRSIIYDRTGGEATRSDFYQSASKGHNFSRKQINAEARAIKSRENADSNTSTIVHEATHQLCYNYGLFSPDFRAPDWVVEGMAMTFEQTTPEAPLGWRFRNIFPVNRSRLNEFRDYANSNPNCEILDEILVSDDFAVRLDGAGYAASWAMFYYCYRKRPKELARYLEIVAKKRPFSKYPKEERLDDFIECFGEIPQFGADFAKFIRSL